MSTAARPFTVLIVDDEPDILTSLTDLIETTIPGVQVIGARSGQDAVAQLAQTHVDLILTDFRMPGMNGLQLLERAQELAPGTPAVMVTAYPDLDVVLTAVNERRARGFVVKPVEPRKLLTVVQEALLTRQAIELRDRALMAALRGDA